MAEVAKVRSGQTLMGSNTVVSFDLILRLDFATETLKVGKYQTQKVERGKRSGSLF